MKQIILLLVVTIVTYSCNTLPNRTYKVSLIPNGIQMGLDINAHTEIQRRSVGFVPGDTVETDVHYIQVIKDTL